MKDSILPDKNQIFIILFTIKSNERIDLLASGLFTEGFFLRSYSVFNMDNKSGELDHWRDYFRSANSDIFEVIEHAILVAASDCPEQFQMRRDRIAEKLYTCRLSLCSGCDRLELAVPHKQGENGINGSSGGQVGGKESKVNSSTDECRELNSQNWVSNYSYDEAEALTEELEEESQLVKEVLRIKELLSSKDEVYFKLPILLVFSFVMYINVFVLVLCWCLIGKK